MRAIARLCCLTASILTVTGCVDDDTDSAAPPEAVLDASGTRIELGPTELKVMTFNVWIGGTVVDIGQVAAAIEASDADVVGLQESDGNVAVIAGLLGWHADERLQIVSRFPLITPPDAEGDYVYVQLAPGQVVALANVHLPSDPYGPYLVRDGSSLEEVLANEIETRMWRVDELTPGWQHAIDADIPLMLTGDFNAPSHRDWTDDVIGDRLQLRYAVEWPVSQAVEALGFIDTYRSVHPDPAANPGITWTFGYPFPRLREDEAQDRIDFVWASGATDIIDSEVVGPSGAGDATILVDPYPSDHLGVVSTVIVDPVEPPPFVSATAARVEIGVPVGVSYHAPGGEETDRIVLVPAGGDPTTDGFASLPPAEAGYFGRVNLGSGGQPAGEYEAVLMSTEPAGDPDGEPIEVSRSRFWLVEPGAVPTVAVQAQTIAAGEPIELTWTSAYARKFDWVGIYAAGDADMYAYYAFAYTGATVDGTYTFGVDDLGDGLLPTGDYVARLMSDDSYVTLAEMPFSVD